MDTRPKTIFLDIDGTLVEHSENISKQYVHTPKLLNGTLEKLAEWDKKGYNIILTTGRKESGRAATEKQLLELGIFYDQLIMGIGGGIRVLINDRKKNKTYDTAVSINLDRNEGISSIKDL
jgi:hydroxymethylpyrimidine pyrophosphatase-like HAD family hydrolase